MTEKKRGEFTALVPSMWAVASLMCFACSAGLKVFGPAVLPVRGIFILAGFVTSGVAVAKLWKAIKNELA